MKRQQVLILVHPSRVEDIAPDLVRQLSGHAATILASGISPKGGAGFMVVEVVQGIPDAVLSWLHQERGVNEYVVYDVADEGEKTGTFPGYAPELAPFPPVTLPHGYQALSVPQPLLSSHDTYWTAWAWSELAGMGLLLYDEGGKAVSFFTAEESVTLLYTLLTRAEELLPRCRPEYLAQHAPGVALVRTHLWALQKEVIREAIRYGEERRRRRASGNQSQEGAEL